MRFRNPADAFLTSLEGLTQRGQTVEVRGTITRELLSQTVTFDLPLERCITVPHRKNNIFATIAETMWVIAGRDDIDFLTPYIPRAIAFSDDGERWSGAYGPRLRNWHGTDQVAEVTSLLRSDPSSRRAVMSIFDPARDFVPSKDIPCTNWLHPIVRDGAVHLDVVMRSNDIIWGFSGINSFEWTVLLEMLAEWLGVRVGSVTFFISSLHLYERHGERAARILASPRPVLWPEGVRQFATAFDDLPRALELWFDAEAAIRNHPTLPDPVDSIDDPLFKDFARMIHLYWLHSAGEIDHASTIVPRIVDPGLRFAAEEYLGRGNSAEFWAIHEARNTSARNRELLATLIELHTGKDAQYGDSWKKRGEFASIVNNIARKADRLARWDESSTPTIDILDTVADLTVYAAKYALFLLESTPADASQYVGTSNTEGLSTGPSGLQLLLEVAGRSWLESEDSATKADVLTHFSSILADFSEGVPVTEPAERLRHAVRLATTSIVLLREITLSHRSVFLDWRTQALRLVVPAEQTLRTQT